MAYRILCPVVKADEIGPLVKAGASEFYGSVLYKRADKGMVTGSPLNWNENPESTITSFDELREIVSACHNNGSRFFFACNSFYRDEDYPAIIDYARRAIDCGVDAIIAADLLFIKKLRESDTKVEIFLSSLASAYNSATISFYDRFKISRAILPKDIPLQSILEISKATDVPLEIFGLNSNCPYDQAMCGFFCAVRDGDRSTRACMLDFEIDSADSGASMKTTHTVRMRHGLRFGSGYLGCGLCSLAELSGTNVVSLKIVGRHLPLEKKLADAGFARSCLEMLDRMSPEEYRAEVRRMFKAHYGRACSQKDCTCIELYE